MEYGFRTKLIIGVIILSLISLFLAGGKPSVKKVKEKFDEPTETTFDKEKTMFDIMDLNKNEKLEESEFPDGEHRKEIFGYDFDGNGVIDLEEFKEYTNRIK